MAGTAIDANAQDIPPGQRRPVGRPRRLTIDAIVDAACELGLDRIEMGPIARRLNTGVGTLYSYVPSREHLLRLVAARLARQFRVEDRGQDWRQLLREHAEMTTAVFAAMPHLIGDLLAIEEETHGHRYSQWFVGLLQARGFALDEAIAIYVEVTQILVGAAICAQQGRRSPRSAADGSDGRPLPAIVGDHRPTLERLIRDVDARHA